MYSAALLTFYLGGTLEMFKSQEEPSIKIIIKVGSGFNVNEGCKLISVNATYNKKVY
jgi:hypothetical protein